MQKSKIGLTFIIILIMFILLSLLAKGEFSLEGFSLLIKSAGILAPIIFIIIFLLVPIFCMPISPLLISAGIIFDPVSGTIYSVIGASLGASLAFLTGRYLIKDYVDKKIPKKLDYIRAKISKDGWKFLLVSRLTPFFPFSIQNYAFSVTTIPLKTFFITSVLGLIPGCFTFVYLGSAGKSAVSGDDGMYFKIIIAIGLLLGFSLLPKLIVKIRYFLSNHVLPIFFKS